MVWLTTMPEILADPLGPIWIRPADFMEAIAGSGRDVAPRHIGRYRRQAERDAVVEGAIRKYHLLES